MSPVPHGMQAFAPLDGVDFRYGQVYRPINDSTYKLGGVEGFLPHNPFKDFQFCPGAMRVATALLAWSCASGAPLLTMHCLAEFNEWLMKDKYNMWPEEELEASMFPPSPSCLDVQDVPTLKPKPAQQPTINGLHAKLVNGHDNLFFVTFKNEWRLVGVAYRDIMASQPDCLLDGKLLVDFYILHPKDYWFGASNQRFFVRVSLTWLFCVHLLEMILP